MENYLERLNGLMRPYFDKTQEIENLVNQNSIEKDKMQSDILELRDKRNKERLLKEQELSKFISDRKDRIHELENQIIINRKGLKTKLEYLREGKQKEISDYLIQAGLSNSAATKTYISMIRNDLENSYSERERSLILDIENKNKEIQNEINSLKNDKQTVKRLNEEIKNLKNISDDEVNIVENMMSLDKSPDYIRVYEKELLDTKIGLRKQILEFEKEVKSDLQKEKVNFDSVMLELSQFKYKYDENHRVINGNEWRELYEKSNVILDRKNNIEKVLNVIKDYMGGVLDYSKDKFLTLTPWEQAEYDRRNKPTKKNENTHIKNDYIGDNSNDYANLTEETPNKKEDAIEETLEDIYIDIVKEIDDMHVVKLDSSDEESYLNTEDGAGIVNLNNEEISLPNGEYVNSNDFNFALDNYFMKNKGNSYTVTGIDKVFKITKDSVSKFKDSLKECSIIRLVKDKIMSALDIQRVYGKEKADSYTKQAKEQQIGMFATGSPDGEYINKQETIEKMKKLLVTPNEKKANWLKKLSDKLKSYKKEEDLSEENINQIDENEIEVVEEHALTR